MKEKIDQEVAKIEAESSSNEDDSSSLDESDLDDDSNDGEVKQKKSGN